MSAQFKLLCLPEGELDAVYSFNTKAERAAFENGYIEGASQYGCGGIYTIEWEKLGCPETFEKEFGNDVRDKCPGTLIYDIEALRVLVGWKE